MDTKKDKELRIRTGTRLLGLIKEYGAPAAMVAKRLGVSATTLSHWRSGDPERLNRVGAPTDIHLQKLVGILNYKIKSNQQELLDMVQGGAVRHREQMMVLKSLEPTFTDFSEKWAKAKTIKAQQIDDFISRLREYHEANDDEVRPDEYWDELMRFCSHMITLPSQEDLAQGLITWDYENLKKNMDGFDDLVMHVERMAEEMIEEDR